MKNLFCKIGSVLFSRCGLLPAILLAVLLLSSCGLLSGANAPQDDLQATISHLEAQTTIQALQSTIDAQKAAPTSIPVHQPAPPAQQAAVTQLVPLPAAVESPLPPMPEPNTDTLEERMKSARILLYEDMIGQPKVRRYVKETLEKMGLPYEDMGSAIGRLKERLVFGASAGEPWDLIIVAAEDRNAPQPTGEYFEYIQANMDRGSSVVLETWMLDRISEGKAKPLLDMCGVGITNYTGAYLSDMDMVLWPINSHILLTEPNNYPKLTKPIFFWKPADLGDLMELTGTGDAQLLIGRKSSDNTKYGVLTSCIDGRLIIQTFSSHSYYLEAMEAVWENYIYNALKVRFMGPQE